MDKIGGFVAEIKASWDAKEFGKEHAALLFLGADFDNECALYQGKLRCCIAMLVSAMEQRDELRQIILQAVEIFLSDKLKEDEEEK